MAFIQRNETGGICGVYRNRQEGYAEEAIDDADPEVAAFLIAAKPSKTPLDPPEKVSLQSLAAQAITDIEAYLTAADKGTAAQIQARDHAAVKALAADVQAIIKRLVQVG